MMIIHVPIKAAMFSMPNAARPKVTNTVMGGKRQPGLLLKVHTERDDYFRTSASFAASISVRANHWPRSLNLAVARATPHSWDRVVDQTLLEHRTAQGTANERCQPIAVRAKV
jgi:hypothetical protein